jgi:hypothetical protein
MGFGVIEIATVDMLVVNGRVYANEQIAKRPYDPIGIVAI